MDTKLLLTTIRTVVLTVVLSLAGALSGMQNAGAVNYVWNKTSGTYTYSDATNWTPNRTTPAVTDVLVFNNGSVVTLTGFTSQTISQIQFSNSTRVSLQSTGTATLTLQGGTGTDLDIPSGSSFTLASTGTNKLLVAYSGTGHAASIAGTLTIAANTALDNTYTCTGATTTVTSTGTVNNTGIITGNTLVFSSGSTYIHNKNTSLPTATYTSVNLTVTGITSLASFTSWPSIKVLRWNCPSQTTTFPINIWNVGTMHFQSTGSGSVTLPNTYLGFSDSLRIDGGIVSIGGGGGSTTTLDITKTFTITGGTLRAMSGVANPIEFTVNGKFLQTGGTITSNMSNGFTFRLRDSLYKTAGTMSTTGAGQIQIHFVAYDNKVQQVSFSGAVTGIVNYSINNGTEGTFSQRGIYLHADLPVNSGAGLWLTVNGSPIRGIGKVAYSSNSTLYLKSTTGQHTLNNNIWSASSSPNNIVIDNSNGVYLHEDRQIDGNINLTNGIFYLSDHTLTMGSTATVSGSPSSSKMIVPERGELKKVFGTGDQNFTYPIGDITSGNDYSPFGVSLSSNTDIRTIGVRVEDGAHPSNGSSSNYLSRWWSISNSNLAGAYEFKIDAYYTSADINGAESLIRGSFWLGSKWFQINDAIAATNKLTPSTFRSSDFDIGGRDFTGRKQDPFIWTGGVNSDWDQDGNWNLSGYPENESSDDAILQNNTVNMPEIRGSASIKSLMITHAIAKLTLTGTGTLNLADSCGISNGSLVLNDDSRVMVAGNFRNAGSLVLDNNSTLSCSGAIKITGTALGSGYCEAVSTSTQDIEGNFTNLKLSSGVKNLTATTAIGGTLTIQDAITALNTNGYLKLISDNSGTGRIAAIPSGATINGNATIERYIPASTRGFRVLCAPVSPFTYQQLIDDIYVSGLSGATNGFDASRNDPTCYTYTETTPGRGWNAATHITNGVSVGKGFLAFVRGDRTLSAPGWYTAPFPAQNAVTIDFTGAVNIGAINNTLTYTNTGNALADGWQMIGNPYPSQIDWDLAAVTKTNITNILYSINPSTGSYEAYNGNTGVSIGGMSNIIPMGQGFFVQATSSGASVVFNEGAKVSTPPFSLFKNNRAGNHIRIKMMKDSTKSDEALLLFNGTASKLYQVGDDVPKMFNTYINIYTESPDSVPMQINSYGAMATTDSIWLSIGSYYTGNHSMVFSGLTSIVSTKQVLLYDAFTASAYDLRTTPSIGFTIGSNPMSSGNRRFCIVISDASSVPVTFGSFHVKPNHDDIDVAWTTYSETNNSHFVVERSFNGVNFTAITSVKSQGNSSHIQTYQVVDKGAFAMMKSEKQAYAIYRIRQVDQNGSEEVSDRRIVEVSGMEELLEVSPNPFTGTITIRLPEKHQDFEISLCDLAGKSYPVHISFTNDGAVVETGDLKSSMYLLRVSSRVTGKTITTKLIRE